MRPHGSSAVDVSFAALRVIESWCVDLDVEVLSDYLAIIIRL